MDVTFAVLLCSIILLNFSEPLQDQWKNLTEVISVFRTRWARCYENAVTELLDAFPVNTLNDKLI